MINFEKQLAKTLDTYTKSNNGLITFQASADEIVHLKALFLVESKDFLYLRKGEDVGQWIIGCVAAALRVASEPEVLETVRNTTNWLRFIGASAGAALSCLKLVEYIKKKLPPKKIAKGETRKLRVLCREDTPDTDDCIEVYEYLGYEIRHYPHVDDAGVQRFYVHESRYCVFHRMPGGMFHGSIGTDKETIVKLKRQFRREWKRSKPHR